MALFTIADLHLSLSVDKPMDEFGGRWDNYVEKIEAGWKSAVSDGDTVVVPGDISWGMNLEQCAADFAFIDALPGKKLLLKGNHDYFWQTVSSMRRFFAERGFTTMDFLHNGFADVEGTAVCGTKGWSFEERKGTAENGAKIFNRELSRLETSLKAAHKAGHGEKAVFMHFPPLYDAADRYEATDLFEKYGVTKCFYGHLHGRATKGATVGKIGNTEYFLISADAVSFTPVRV